MSNFKEQSYVYKRVKVNKFNSQYIIDEKEIKDCFLTSRIKIETYQNFSKATNIDYYFRLRGLTSWKGGESVTGLFKTTNPNIYFGYRKKRPSRKHKKNDNISILRQ